MENNLKLIDCVNAAKLSKLSSVTNVIFAQNLLFVKIGLIKEGKNPPLKIDKRIANLQQVLGYYFNIQKIRFENKELNNISEISNIINYWITMLAKKLK